MNTPAWMPNRGLWEAIHTLCRLAPVLAVLWGGPAHAIAVISPLVIDVEESIIWRTPSPFPGGTFTGSSAFQSGFFSQSGSFSGSGKVAFDDISFTKHIDTSSPILFPPFPIRPHDSIIWEFGGIIQNASGSFATEAFPPCRDCPPPPLPTPYPPIITIGLDLLPGFAPITVTGDIFAFDAPVQVGTYEIRVSPVPEPGSLLLVGIGLAALVTLGSVRPTSLRRGNATQCP